MGKLERGVKSVPIFTALAVRRINDLIVGKHRSPRRLHRSEGLVNRMKSFLENPSRIVDELYIGNAANAADSGFFRKNNIKNVLNVTKYTKNHFPRRVNYMRIPISDARGIEFGKQIRKGVRFIETSLARGEPILVHCVMGCSRSVTVVVGYIMKRYNMTRDEAYDLVKARRVIANPNISFWNELKKLEN